jgi:dipeptidyl aminopeptidase/acylaminoacyl peptidase
MQPTEALEFSVAMMAKVCSCWSPSFSPDGTQIAFISDLNGIPQIWTVAAEGGWPRLVTALPDQIIKVIWSPDGHWLAFNAAPGGGMNQQIYCIRPDGTDMRLLTDGGSETNWLHFWAVDSTRVAVASNRANRSAMDVYLIDIQTGEFSLVAKNQGIGRLTDVQMDKQLAVLYRMANRSDSNLYLLDISNHTERLLTPHEGPGNFTNARFAPDGTTIYLTSDLYRDRVAFARVVSGEWNIEIIAQRDDAELSDFTITEDGSVAALVWNVFGRSELDFVDLKTGSITPGPILPAEIILDVSFSRNGSLLTFRASGAAAPDDIWVYNRHTSDLWQVTHSPHPGVNLDTLIRPELVRFQAHDGLELSAWLYRPAEFPAPGPVVLSFHGGPEGQERPNFDSTYQALLSQGIAVFAPNVRGSGGFGKTFVNLDNGALRFNAIRDIKACVDYVVQAGIAAPGRIGIMGGSYGGYMTMAGLTDYPALFAAGANIYGVVNFKTFFANTEPWMAAISKIEYGDPDTEGDLLDSLSPIFKIDRVTAPTLVLHGANDTNVPVVEAEQVVNSLKSQGVSVEYILFPDEGHGFQKEANRIQAAVSIVKWFVHYLQEVNRP